MAELNDRNTDALFQAGAERHEFEYNPEAWALMESKLNATPPSAARRKPLGWIITGTLMLLALIALTWLVWSPPSAPSLLTQTGASGAVDIPSNAAGAETASNRERPADGGKPTDREKISRAAPAGGAESLNASFTPSNQLAQGAEGVHDNQFRLNTGGVIGDPLTARRVPAEDHGEGSTHQSGTPSLNPVTGFPAAIESEEGPARPTTFRLNQPASVLVDTKNLLSPVHSVEPGGWLPPMPSAQSGANFSKLTATGGWRATIGAGIVTGRSGNVALPKVQPRLGLAIERRISPKFGVATGAYLNLAHYRIQGDLYEAKPDFFVQGIQPAEVKAACALIELPVSVKYYFTGSGTNGFYASAGAVSYLMLKEDYKYKYREENAALKKEWTERSSGRHLFGVGLASFGYQHRLPGRGFLALETFVHLPFTGMGHGNVMLRSAGLSLKYQFDFSGRR